LEKLGGDAIVSSFRKMSRSHKISCGCQKPHLAIEIV
jgi:hypothetical protein